MSILAAVFIGGAILSIIVATISYRTYESFFLARKERWFGNESRQPAGAGALPVVAPVRIS